MKRAILIAGLALAACDAADEASMTVEPGEALPGGETTNTLLFGHNAFIRPAENITDAHALHFYSGNSFFNQSWVQAPSSTALRDGLGPLFNARSCAACHFRDGRGRPPLTDDEPFNSILLRLSVPGAAEEEAPLPEPTYGGQLQPFALPDVPAEANPRIDWTEVRGEYADGEPYTLLRPTYVIADPSLGPLVDEVQVSARVAPQVIGLGLLEAIPEADLRALADPDDADGDGISGRLNRVWDATDGALRVGRFGWKAEQPSIRQQVAGAFLGDIGITSPVFGDGECTDAQTLCAEAASGGSPEIEAPQFERVVLYSSLLAVPARRSPGDADVLHGKALFHEAGCAVCHVPSHRTGTHPDLPELSDQLIWPYTDLLLHDLGDDLDDGRPVFAAQGNEWRTPPLWGLGLVPAVNGHDRLLHDGRARGFAEAILWHGGEAEAAREAFRHLNADARADLIRFLETL
ncbi:MAG: c-type cytochrome [Myxococcales bacterium]|nr:c-type cytochrome [Myxococcales bacterium]